MKRKISLIAIAAAGCFALPPAARARRRMMPIRSNDYEPKSHVACRPVGQ